MHLFAVLQWKKGGKSHWKEHCLKLGENLASFLKIKRYEIIACPSSIQKQREQYCVYEKHFMANGGI